MNSRFQFLGFEPPSGVEFYAHRRLADIEKSLDQVISAKGLIVRESKGYSFSIIASTLFGFFTSETFVSFETLEDKAPYWELSVLDRIGRDVLDQVNSWQDESAL